MSVIARLNYLHIAPRKVRLIADLIRKKTAKEAEAILSFLPKRAALPIIKLLRSAVSNAKNNFSLEESNLYISKITVDEGPKMKKWMPRARGSPSQIQKKTSHVTLVLDEIEKGEAKIQKIQKPSTIGEERKPEEVVKNIQKPKIPRTETAAKKPRFERVARRIFGRKSFSK
jgi:large subunit ribosomal protein L22